MRIRTVALAAGAWAVAWWTLPVLLHLTLPAEVRGQAMDVVLLPGNAFAQWSGAPFAVSQLVPPAVMVLVAALTTAMLCLLFRALDREGHAAEAVRWLPRTAAAFGLWCVAGVSAFLLATWLDDRLADDASVEWVSLPVLLVCLLAVPFFALRSDVIASDQPPRLWRPAWPGTAALTLSVTAVAMWMVLGFTTGVVFDGRPGVDLLLQLIFWVPGAWIATVCLRAWQTRARWRSLGAPVRFASRIRTLRTLLATDVAIVMACVSVLAAPLLLTAATLIWVMPQTEALVMDAGRVLPTALQVYARAGRAVVDASWLLPLLLWWPMLALRGRALLLAARTIGEDALRPS